MTDWEQLVEILKAIGAIVTPIAMAFMAYYQWRTKERVKEVQSGVDDAKQHAVEAKTEATASRIVADDTNTKVDRLETNTNAKMDQLLKVTNAASYQAGGDDEKARSSIGSGDSRL